MVNFEPHILIRWGGTLGEDTWSCGMRFMQTAGNVSNDQWASDNLEDCAAAAFTFSASASSTVPAATASSTAASHASTKASWSA